MLDTDVTLGANSDDKIASQRAVKDFMSTNPVKVYKSGVLKVSPKVYVTSATVSSGSVTVNLTDDNTSSGTALFANVYKESMNWWIEDATSSYQLGSYTLSGNKKTLTLTVNKLGSIVLGLIQFVSAANGAVVNVTVWGD